MCAHMRARSCSRPEGLVARETFVEDTAECVHVGPCIECFATDLLRRCVSRSSEERSVLGQGPTRDPPREAEVAKKSVGTAAREKHIRRLHISMHDPGDMCRIEGVTDLRDDERRPIGLQSDLGTKQFG